MPSFVVGATKHHCPLDGKGQGPCREGRPPGGGQKMCLNHQKKCSNLDCNAIHLKTEPCRDCLRGGKHRDQRIKEEQAVAEKKAAKQREKDELMGRDPNAPKYKKRK